MKTERTCLILVNLLFFSLATFFFSSCNTWKAAQRKFATTVVDTSYQTVRQVVPYDSVSLRVVTDTTTIYKEVRQGRARIIYQRNGQTTYVKADCDSVIVEKKVPYYIKKQVWGIDPKIQKLADKYQRQANTWRTVASILLGLIILTVGINLFNRKYKLNTGISIQKRA